MESNDDFYKCFESNLETLELARGGHILCSPTLMYKASNDPTDEKLKLEEDKFKAMCLLKQSDTTRYQELTTLLKISAYLGKDKYPQMRSAAYNVLVYRSGAINSGHGRIGQRHGEYKNDGRGKGRGCGHYHAVFVQHRREDCIPGTDSQINVCAKGYTCNKPGHIASFCPTPGARRFMQIHHNFFQGTDIPHMGAFRYVLRSKLCKQC
eukprot:10495716-Ditylum_brightwellii.AAC.1